MELSPRDTTMQDGALWFMIIEATLWRQLQAGVSMFLMHFMQNSVRQSKLSG
jgi:hypothetical protein